MPHASSGGILRPNASYPIPILPDKMSDFLDKVAGARTTTFVINATSLVANTGAAPIPNCLGPIVDALASLQKTIQDSKALQVWPHRCADTAVLNQNKHRIRAAASLISVTPYWTPLQHIAH